MNFTELETLLLLAVGVLLWRIEVLKRLAKEEAELVNRYVGFLQDIYYGKGRVSRRSDGSFYFTKDRHEKPDQARQGQSTDRA